MLEKCYTDIVVRDIHVRQIMRYVARVHGATRESAAGTPRANWPYTSVQYKRCRQLCALEKNHEYKRITRDFTINV